MANVAPVSTGGSSRPAWVNAQFDAVARALDARGVPVDLALPVARWVVCLQWLESGEGTHEWNFNAGNVHCTGTPDPAGTPGWHGDCVRVGSELLRAYASRDDAVSDFLGLMQSSRYRGSSWAYLLSNPEDGAGWYARLQQDGYSSRSQANVDLLVTLARSFTRVRGG